MESRIKNLREKRGIIQEILAAELGITQQMLSKYEKDVTVIKVDILKRLAEYFNVTTDYLLGIVESGTGCISGSCYHRTACATTHNFCF